MRKRNTAGSRWLKLKFNEVWWQSGKFDGFFYWSCYARVLVDPEVITAAPFPLILPTPLFFILYTYYPPDEIYPLPVRQFIASICGQFCEFSQSNVTKILFYNTFFFRNMTFLILMINNNKNNQHCLYTDNSQDDQ